MVAGTTSDITKTSCVPRDFQKCLNNFSQTLWMAGPTFYA